MKRSMLSFLDGFFAATCGCALLLFVLEQIGIGAFCFEDNFLTQSFSGTSISQPDCFLANSGVAYNLKVFVVGQIAFGLLLAVLSFATSVGFLAARPWSASMATFQGLLCLLFFVEVRFASNAFVREAVVGIIVSSLVMARAAVLKRLSEPKLVGRDAR